MTGSALVSGCACVTKTRYFGLLEFGPIIVKFLAFHVILLKGVPLVDPVVAPITMLPLHLLRLGGSSFSGLLN